MSICTVQCHLVLCTLHPQAVGCTTPRGSVQIQFNRHINPRQAVGRSCPWRRVMHPGAVHVQKLYARLSGWIIICMSSFEMTKCSHILGYGLYMGCQQGHDCTRRMCYSDHCFSVTRVCFMEQVPCSTTRASCCMWEQPSFGVTGGAPTSSAALTKP